MCAIKSWLWIMLLLGVGLAGCLHVHVHTAPEAQGGLGLEPGDRVVALWREGFWEATVLRVESKLVTVAWDVPPPEQSAVPRSWVQRLDARPEPGSDEPWLLCPEGDAWALCQVQAWQDGRVQVLMATSGEPRSLASQDLLLLPEEVRTWAAQHGTSALEHVMAMRALSKVVPSAAGQHVSPGQLVVARWQDGQWWSGVVSAVADDGVTISWPDGSPDSLLSAQAVAPIAQSRRVFDVGEPVLCLRQDRALWWQARVMRAADAQLEVLFASGDTEQALTQDCVPGRVLDEN